MAGAIYWQIFLDHDQLGKTRDFEQQRLEQLVGDVSEKLSKGSTALLQYLHDGHSDNKRPQQSVEASLARHAEHPEESGTGVAAKIEGEPHSLEWPWTCYLYETMMEISNRTKGS